MHTADTSEPAGNLVNKYKLPQPVYVTKPTMPPLEDYHKLLEQIWESKWLTRAIALKSVPG